jgi:heavy metal sensor kinase
MTLLPGSIAGRLLLWQTTGVTAIMLMLGLIMYIEVREIVFTSMDRVLHSKAQILSGLIHDKDGTVELELSDIIAGDYVIPRSGHYYRVTKGSKILASSPSLTDDSFSFRPTGRDNTEYDSGELFFNSTGPANEPVRVLQYRYMAFGDIFEMTLAETMSEGAEMVDTFRGFLLVILPIGILSLCLIAWYIIRTSLSPVAKFNAVIKRITHRNMDERLDPQKTALELSSLASSFNDMLERLHHVLESQKRLLADASHELKTPLTVIRTQCDVALFRERTPTEYNQAIYEIRAETDKMTQRVNNLLSLSRLDAGVICAMQFSPVLVNELIYRAVKMTEKAASRAGVRITVSTDEHLKVYGAQSALEEAILNLVENAIRYNRSGGQVNISASLQRTGEVAIVINDTGIGIADEDREMIFERFYRSKAVRDIEGSGLGLSIVKSIVEAHGGKISVSSEPGNWSRFTIILPLATEEQASGNTKNKITQKEI